MANKQEYVLTAIDKGGNWIEGTTADGLRFYAKVYSEGSEYGINEGRVSKLTVRDSNKREIMNYDRGWDKKAKGADGRRILKALLEYLENLPVEE